MVYTIEKKFFLLWHGSYRRYILAHFLPADEYRAYFSLRTYADPIHAPHVLNRWLKLYIPPVMEIVIVAFIVRGQDDGTRIYNA